MEFRASKRGSAALAALAQPFFALAATSLTGSAYWPGLMSWDPVRQYGEALSGDITDWHPPAMQRVWQRLITLQPGPAPMLVLQLGLYWGGLTILAGALRRRSRELAWGLLACGLLPLGLTLTGMILKDCLMAGALLVATGLLAWQVERRHWAFSLIACAMLIVAATLRFNAFSACLPLLIALLPRASWRTLPRLGLVSLFGTSALMAAMPVANQLIGATPSGVPLSLVLFDLGGITEHGGVSVFPEEMEARDPVAVNNACYRPRKWDSYSDWVEPECPLRYTAWNDNIDPAEIQPYRVWVRAILEHPFAYAAHRVHHFAINVRLLPLADAVERPVPNHDAPSPWGFHTTPNRRMAVLDALAMATAHTPLGWPIVWIGLALGALIASHGLPNAGLVVPVALSSLL